MEATYPYDIKNQRGARNTPQWGYFCDELVLYGIRLSQILDMEIDQTAVRSSKQAEREKEAKMRNKTARAAMRAKSREETPQGETGPNMAQAAPSQ